MFEKRQRLIAMARRWEDVAGKASPAAVSKKLVDIQALLKWAYFDELPKAEIRQAKPLRQFRERWASVADFGDYIAASERRSCRLFASPQRFDRWGEPHEDALVVARAVGNLDSQILDIPEDLNPFSDFFGAGAESQKLKAQIFSESKVRTRKGISKLRFKPSALVFNHTILGGCPAWQVHEEGAANFKDLSKGQALAIGLARAEYEIWQISLAHLAASLAMQLVMHELLPSLPPVRPWEAAAGSKKRILPVLDGPFVDLTDPGHAAQRPAY